MSSDQTQIDSQSLSIYSFMLPEHMVASAWLEHAPFAFWLATTVKCRSFVELGTHNGFSYFSFCQAVKRLSSGTSCYAIDTWKGDEHAGFYDTSVFYSVHDVNKKYESFSTLITSLFDDAVAYFPDQSIDILHIDGRHFYDDVKHDYETWLPKLAEDAVVLFHDTNVRERNFGVWRFFHELQEAHPSFEFTHGHGLGIIAPGHIPDALKGFLNASLERASATREIYSFLGANIKREFYAKQFQAETAQQLQRASSIEGEWKERLSTVEQRASSIEGEWRERLASQTAALEDHWKARLSAVESRWRDENSGLRVKLASLSHDIAARTAESAWLENRYDALLERAERQVQNLILVLSKSNSGRNTKVPREIVKYGGSKTASLFEDFTLIAGSPLFDPGWYLTEYPDVLEKEEATLHFTKYGGQYALKAGPFFNTGKYIELNKSFNALHENPLVNFLKSEVKDHASLELARHLLAPENEGTGRPLPPAVPMGAQYGLVKSWPIEMPDFFALRKFKPKNRLAVVVHIYYEDICEELLQLCENISEPFDIFVSLVVNHTSHLASVVKARLPEACVFIFPNRGRDILPFFSLASTGVFSSYDLICKLHTKRSPHRIDGDEWRRHLTTSILPSLEGTAAIVESFRRDLDLGVVVADGQLFKGADSWLGNILHSEKLLPLLGYSLSAAMDLAFAGGSIFWIRPLLLRDVCGLPITPDMFEPEPIGSDGSLAHTIERLFSISCHGAGMKIVEASMLLADWEHKKQSIPKERAPIPRVVAFYLPQFHPIPENDAWWGKGFTEWTNVTKAHPLFEGHRQPRLPGELGFTDLRLADTRKAQAALAKAHGISAFCYYYYWFGEGRRVLERPLDEVLASGEPDFPFMICWANEPWSRNWDGVSKDVLLAQDYPDGWIEAFARSIAPLLADKRYVRLDGAEGPPMLMIYRIMHVPSPAQSLADLRVALRELGVPDVHIAAGWFALGSDEFPPKDPAELGLDSYFEFPPHNIKAVPVAPDAMPSNITGQVYQYGATVDAVLAHQVTDLAAPDRHRGIMMGWDNTARRGTAAYAFHGATPGHFRRWLTAVVRQQQSSAPAEERLVFINAWNEWAEGSCLEPDRDFGRGWLEAVRDVVGCASASDVQLEDKC